MREIERRALSRLSRARIFGVSLVALLQAFAPAQTTFTFRQGLNGYAGAVDTFIQTGFPDASNGGAETIKWDTNDPPGAGQNTFALIRFDKMFGPGPGQIPVGSTITSATLTYSLLSGASFGSMQEIVTNWSGLTTFNTFGSAPGVQVGSDISSRYIASLPGAGSTATVDVWENVAAWVSDPTLNLGWALGPINPITRGTFYSSEYLLNPTLRPTLTITVNTTGIPTLIRTPYLQSPSPTAMTISWRTDMKTNSVVHYGLAPNALTNTVTDTKNVFDHTVRIAGLQPDTTYFYSVGALQMTIAGGDVNHTFTTPPAAGTIIPFTVWAFADSGTASVNLAATRDAMLAFNGGPPDLILSAGDIAYFLGADGQYTRDLFIPFASVLTQTPFWPAIGTHDAININSAAQTGPFFQAFSLPSNGESGGVPSGTEAYYSFDYANAHFVSINSSESNMSPSGPMLTWLTQDLVATNADWVIAVVYDAPYSHGSHNSDTETRMTLVRENVVPILESYGVDLVISGHSHSYERSFLIDGAYETPSIIGTHILDAGNGNPIHGHAYMKPPGRVPHAGAVYTVVGHIERHQFVGVHPLIAFGEAINGSALISINGDTLMFQNVRSTGVVSDTFTIQKPVPPPSPDLNGDGVVNSADLAILLGQWGTAGSADLNSDGVVGSADLATLLGQWG